MDRNELERELRLLYVAHQELSAAPYKHRACTSCDARMAKVMALIDRYVSSR